MSGALLASAVAWGSILVARRLPFERALGEAGMRVLAGTSLAVVGLVLLGVPLPAYGPWAVLVGAAIVAFAVGRATSSPSS